MIDKQQLIECIEGMSDSERRKVLHMLMGRDGERDLSFLSEVRSFSTTPQFIFSCPQCAYTELTSMRYPFDCSACGWSEGKAL